MLKTGINRVVYLMPFLLTAATCAQEPLESEVGRTQPAPASVRNSEVVMHEVILGDSTAVIEEYKGGDENILAMIVLNSGDSTAYKVGVGFVRENGGRMVGVRTNDGSNMAFTVEDKLYSFDPGRVFTVRGIRETIGSQNTPSSFYQVQVFANRLIAIYNPDWIVVELSDHDASDFSSRSYQAGGDLAHLALAAHAQPGVDPGNFFVVSDSELYDVLRLAGFNVVRLNSQSAGDDGSLSVWAARNGLRYVKVEAVYEHEVEQQAMLEGLVQVLESLPSRMGAN